MQWSLKTIGGYFLSPDAFLIHDVHELLHTLLKIITVFLINHHSSLQSLQVIGFYCFLEINLDSG